MSSKEQSHPEHCKAELQLSNDGWR